MSRIRIAALAATMLVVPFAFAQEIDVKDVIKKAIAAHGGEKELGKFNAATSKYKGTMKLMGQDRDITGENSVLKPDKLRSSITIDIGGNMINVLTVFDGKTLWVAAGGQTKEINDEKTINEVKQSLMTELGAGLLELTQPGFELSAIGEVKVKGKDTIGIRVSKKGQRDISYYFDKKTHLIAKAESRSYDAMSGQEVTQEKIISGYHDKNGIKAAKRVEILKDGEPFMDLEIVDLQVFDKLDADLFAKP